jgi:hypothetical protein
MKYHSVFGAAAAAMLGLGLITLAGCGSGGSGNGGGNGTPPAITSFSSSPATITSGQSSNLTGVFSGGSGVVTPGNIPVTSGTAVPVSPTTNTTYTLTVTASGGATSTATVIVTVDPAPAITSFTASPATVTSGGGSAGLAAVFSGGTGVVTPGNITVTSGIPVGVTPTSTTTYTLTVTNSANTSATSTATVTFSTQTLQSSVTVDPANHGIAVTNQLLGMNMAVWYDIVTNQSAITTAFQNAGIKAVRWPGGSTSDDYHWQNNSTCENAYADPNDTFANFVNDLAVPDSLDVALTADYGSDTACTGPGVATEAAAWVTQAVADGITVSHMTVGNEEYGSWEEDMHSPASDQHNPTVYASEIVGTSGYYALIKAASPNTLVGIDVDADNTPGGWDDTVMANAAGSYDFVEYHYYPQAPGQESDSYLVAQAAPGLTTNINTLKQELAAAGKPNTPIYVGEMGSVYTNPGKQSMSITQGLYAGQMLGEMMNDGVSRSTWWIGFGNCNGTNGNDSSTLYGWQDFGAYNVFSDGDEDSCMPWGSIGTMSPTARAFELFSNVAVNGEHVLTPDVTGDTTDTRAYAATHSGGTALVLFNVNESTNVSVTVTVNGETTSPGVTVITYSKAIYDQTMNDAWDAPTSTNMGSQPLPLTLTLAPWSMNVVLIQ